MKVIVDAFKFPFLIITLPIEWAYFSHIHKHIFYSVD